MRPLELIDQMLSKKPFSCTEKQMRFLRDLVVSHQDTAAVRESDRIHSRKTLTALRQEFIRAQKNFEAASKVLADHQKEYDKLHGDESPQVKKVPALICPQCGSTKVSKGFTGWSDGQRIKPDGKLYCYGCKKVTTKTGKVIPFEKEDWYTQEIAEDQWRQWEEQERTRKYHDGEHLE